jgi:hypothetical protein
MPAGSRSHHKVGQLIIPFSDCIDSCTEGVNQDSWVEMEHTYPIRTFRTNRESSQDPLDNIHPFFPGSGKLQRQYALNRWTLFL